jgi:hypothetical protein
VAVTRIPDDGLVQSLIRGDRFVRVQYVGDPNSLSFYPSVSFASESRAEASRDFDRRLHDYYGVSFVPSQTEAALPGGASRP